MANGELSGESSGDSSTAAEAGASSSEAPWVSREAEAEPGAEASASRFLITSQHVKNAVAKNLDLCGLLGEFVLFDRRIPGEHLEMEEVS